MADITADQVVEAAKEINPADFTRPALAEKLGVDKSEIKKAFREARQGGRIEKTSNDAENVSHFKVAE